MAFNCNDLWHDIPVVKNLKESPYSNSLFRISLSDFLYIWQGFESKDLTQKRDRLEKIFNSNYFDKYIVLIDKVSLENLKATTFYKPSPKDGSGFIYIYTYEDNVLAGLYKKGFLFWENSRYEAKIKIGRTEQHPFYRIEQQLNPKVNIPEPPILLAVLWTKLVAPCERSIHQELTAEGKRLVDRQGREAKGGVEWFKDTPTYSLPTIYKWVKHFRECLGIELNDDLEDEEKELVGRKGRGSKKFKHYEELQLDLLDEALEENSERISIPTPLTPSLVRPEKPKSLQQASVKSTTLAKSKPEKLLLDEPQEQVKEAEKPQAIFLTGNVSVQELAAKMAIRATEIIRTLFAKGFIINITQTLDVETAAMVAQELGVLVETGTTESEARKETEMLAVEDLENLHHRPPIVTIMGHVDHGKTSLLDSIRKTKVAQGEAGGITQNIGAYYVDVEHNGKMQQVVFLDTPGHEAFTAMRARGARVTDVVVLVVAADDGVRPQTVEAISHAKAAEVPIVVAINKVDKEEAQPERVKQELAEYNLVPEEWGGDTIMVPISAINGENLDALLEMILLVSEVEDLYANPDRPAKGTVIEAKLDKARGPVATLLIQNGTLRVGDILVAGSALGKVRAMINDRGKRVNIATPSFAVEVLGLSDVPAVGDAFDIYLEEKEARSVANSRADQQHQSHLQQTMASRRVSLSSLSAQAQEGDLKELNLLLKADLQGSVEAILGALQQLPQKEVQVRVLLAALGEITETDVDLAAASNAVIIGFNTTFASGARQAADTAGVDVRAYNVIYHLLDDVQGAMEGLLKPELVEEPLGQAEVRAVFQVGRGTVAGCYIQSGKVIRNCRVRVRRNGEVVFEGNLDSLKRVKDDVREINAGYECGIGIDNFKDWEVGDVIKIFRLVTKRRTLSI